MTVTRGIFDNTTSSNSNNANINSNKKNKKRHIDDDVLVYIAKNGWKFIRSGYSLIQENKLYDENNPQKIRLKRAGLRFSIISYNTVINMKVFSTTYKEKWDTLTYSDVDVKANAKFQIMDPLKFYKKFCGEDIENIMKKDHKKLNELIYAEIAKVIRYLIAQCEYESLKQLSNVTTEIIRNNNNEYILKLSNRTENNIVFSNFESEVKSHILRELNAILAEYGVATLSLGVLDSTLPESVRKLEEKMTTENMEAEITKVQAKAQKERMEILAKGEKERITTIGQGYADLGMTAENIKEIEVAKNAKNLTIINGGTISPEIYAASQGIQQNAENENNKRNSR